ncbi:MAG: hypothetical protein SVT56_01775 [Chloroflexota bacterium]|nr:hypothetical protein [Chloroflexota bacterium]
MAEESKGFILPEDEELDELVEEFLDYVGYFGLNRGVGLHFDTRIETLKREELEHLVREFIRFAKEEPPDPERMRKMQMGEDLD